MVSPHRPEVQQTHTDSPQSRVRELLDAARAYRWPGGKNAGKFLADLDTQFIQWAADRTWDEHVKAMCLAVLQFREAEAIAAKLRKRLASKSLDELLYLLIASSDRIDELEKRLAVAEEKISDLRGEDRS
jgi:hypothetical protein